MVRLVRVLTMAGTLLLCAARTAAEPAPASAPVNGSLLVFIPPGVVAAPPAVPPTSKWTLVGCWTPRSGTPCSDIYRDPQGGLWLCKACGTTGNATPGKCRTITQAELDRGLWCS